MRHFKKTVDGFHSSFSEITKEDYDAELKSMLESDEWFAISKASSMSTDMREFRNKIDNSSVILWRVV